MDGVSHSFFTEARTARAAEGHGVNSVVTTIIDHDTATIQGVGYFVGYGQIAREHACLQAVINVIGQVNRFLNIPECVERDHWAKHLFFGDAAIGGDVVQNRWLVVAALAFTTRQYSGAPGYSILHKFTDLERNGRFGWVVVCEEEAAVVTILRIERKARSLQREGLNRVAGVDSPGTLVSGIHSVSDRAGRPTVTNASQ